MTFGQRRAHKYIWLTLAIAIPAIMIFATKDLNILPSKKIGKSNDLVTNKIALKIFENDIVKVSLFENQMEVILKATLKNSSSVIYEMNIAGEKSNTLGQLSTAGIYKFNIKNLPTGIIISDDLKMEESTKFLF